MTYTYDPQVLDQLALHGLRPTLATPPELAHEFVSDLYRFELRRLRARQVSGEIDKQDYVGYVIELRRKYILISVPTISWIQGRPSQEQPDKSA